LAARLKRPYLSSGENFAGRVVDALAPQAGHDAFIVNAPQAGQRRMCCITISTQNGFKNVSAENCG